MEDITITSMHQFIEICLKDANLHLFRGQGNSDWPLLPGICRDAFKRNALNDNPKTLHEAEKHVFKLFKERAIRYMGNLASTEIEKLAVAQHYGLPTRFLDFTTSPLVALFFAVEGESDDDGCVFILPRLVTADKGSNPFAIDKDYLVLPPHADERIPAQHGCFVLPQDPFKPFTHEGMKKLLIPSGKKRDLKHQLHRLGINAATVFPGLEGVAKSIAALQWIKVPN